MFRLQAVLDEHRRERLAIDAARRLTARDVLKRLSALFVRRGVPDYIRSDNGSEFRAKTVRSWRDRVDVKALFITQGSPWVNDYIEPFNGTLRDGLLNGEVFDTLLEAKLLIERWRVVYNTICLHSCLGYRPPAPETIRPGLQSATWKSSMTFLLKEKDLQTLNLILGMILWYGAYSDRLHR